MPALTVETIPTPALLIDEASVDRNLKRMADYVRSHGLKLRPHTKTHKSLLMARKQLDAGASGLTVAKVGELEVMAQVCDDLLLAYPALDAARTGRIAAVARKKTVRVAVDSQFAADQLATAARDAGTTLGILVDFDAGMKRTGLPTAEATVELAQHVDRTPGLRLDGLFCYPGHIASFDRDEMATQLQAVDGMIRHVLDLWKQHGLNAGIVSGGSTPAAGMAHLVTAYTEVRPGTYIYNDRFVKGGGWCSAEDCAATVLATVVSRAGDDRCVVDAGGKALTYDRIARLPGPLSFGDLREYPGAFVARLSEEHGVVDLTESARKPSLGERVSLLMTHVCPCVNLYDQVYLRRIDGTVEPLKIDTRGMLS